MGQRHQLEFKKGIENKFLNSKKDFNKSEIKTDFNLVELQSQGLFNLSQIITLIFHLAQNPRKPN